ncbi:MAG: head-tail adaptor protein [Selenomonadaceae bacterium]|nr:head-tail adaptor protein [Selenomonadaceae bacterium]MBR1730691.1 head-tail adaptor protein [Selenomonadaceae bacterium]
MKATGNIINNTSVDDLSERIKIVYFEAQRNNLGDIIKNEEITRCEVWAKVLPLSAKRNLDSSVELTNEIIYRIVVRYRTDILPDDLIIWRRKKLRQTIPAYDAESRKIWTILECVEMVKDG